MSLLVAFPRVQRSSEETAEVRSWRLRSGRRDVSPATDHRKPPLLQVLMKRKVEQDVAAKAKARKDAFVLPSLSHLPLDDASGDASACARPLSAPRPRDPGQIARAGTSVRRKG